MRRCVGDICGQITPMVPTVLTTLALAIASSVDVMTTRWNAPQVQFVPILFISFAMGALNTSFIENGEVSIPLSYVTGPLVKMGQGIERHISGGSANPDRRNNLLRRDDVVHIPTYREELDRPGMIGKATEAHISATVPPQDEIHRAGAVRDQQRLVVGQWAQCEVLSVSATDLCDDHLSRHDAVGMRPTWTCSVRTSAKPVRRNAARRWNTLPPETKTASTLVRELATSVAVMASMSSSTVCQP